MLIFNLEKFMKKYLIVLLTMCVMSLTSCGWLSNETVTTTVTNIETKRGSGENASDKYIVFTPAGVFENTDSFIKWKFNSSDLQNKLAEAKANKTSVKLTYYWVRNNFLSWYQNIVVVTPIDGKS